MIAPHPQFQQRMSRSLKAQSLLRWLIEHASNSGRNAPSVGSAESRPNAVKVDCKTRPRPVRLHLGEDARPKVNRSRFCRKRSRHGDQDPVNLGLLLIEEANELVVLLDRL